MGRSYQGKREIISTSQIILFCSHGEMLSRGKVVLTRDKNYFGHRDLACQEARSRYPEKNFVPHERNVTFQLTRRDNFCPYEQAPSQAEHNYMNIHLHRVGFKCSKVNK